jgi:hypothetical protein
MAITATLATAALRSHKGRIDELAAAEKINSSYAWGVPRLTLLALLKSAPVGWAKQDMRIST